MAWKATCGVTQLPISEGTPVVLIPLIVKQPDFLARDALSGGGAVANDLIAQPIALPLTGDYDDYGGIDVEEAQPAERYLQRALKAWASSGVLLRNISGKPTPVSADAVKESDGSDDDMLRLLLAGDLLLAVPNSRKEWLEQLHETYAEASEEEKRGLSHYLPQMEVNPDTLPDMIPCALGAMFVPKALYESLANVIGAEEAVGRFDEKAGKMVRHKGNRRSELQHWCTMTKQHRKNLNAALAEFQKGLDSGELDVDKVALVRKVFVQQALAPASELNGHRFYSTKTADEALLDAALQDDEAARDLWVTFMLFSSAFSLMRKQWTPQAGAGDSTELYEVVNLYRAAHDFVAQTLAAEDAEDTEDA